MVAAYEISHDWEEPEELHGLLEAVRERRPEANIRKIRFAYFQAETAHKGQSRTSGEAYIHHPLAVARILVDLNMDEDVVCAALLHDVLEDTQALSALDIERDFGKDVLAMVEGVTKLTFKHQGELNARQQRAAETARTAESLRKMLLAMAEDFRVMVIKLADRLHNMQTLDCLSSEKKARIASETLDVYAPLAARLGIWQLKWQLEDLSFKALHPAEFQEISGLVAATRKEREDELNEAMVVLKQRFEERNIKVLDIRGRPKHLFSIFNKMVKQQKNFEEIYDLLALRIIVETVPDCYLALGIVHESFIPIPQLFYDYIAKPKPNGYQSLHTKVVGKGGQPLEIQIRTRQMHEVAEFGVAAHWTYKEGKAASDEAKRLSTLREQLFDWSSDSRLSSDFLRNVSTDLFSEQVFVFTPKGDVLDLPKGSTPIDFAFRVHTQLGMTLVGARVNGSIVPLNSELKNGDVVELVTRSNASPSVDWLQYTRSAHTRSKLRAHFRKQSRVEDSQRGRDALDKELKAQGLDPRMYLGEEKLNDVATQIPGADNGTDVLAKVGAGLLAVQGVVAKLRGTIHEQHQGDRIEVTKTREGKMALVAGGIENLLVNRGKCCSPIPGDEIVGYVTRGRGIMIHRKVCPNALAYQTSEPDRLLVFNWPSDGQLYSVTLKVVSLNRQGLLADVSTIFADLKTNVSAAKINTAVNHTAEILVSIDVRDTEHLQQVMNRISNLSDVISIYRMFGRTAK
jgi:GTP pyrophosphokinase